MSKDAAFGEEVVARLTATGLPCKTTIVMVEGRPILVGFLDGVRVRATWRLRHPFFSNSEYLLWLSVGDIERWKGETGTPTAEILRRWVCSAKEMSAQKGIRQKKSRLSKKLVKEYGSLLGKGMAAAKMVESDVVKVRRLLSFAEQHGFFDEEAARLLETGQ